MEHTPLGLANEQSKIELLNRRLKVFDCVSFKVEFKASVHPSLWRPSPGGFPPQETLWPAGSSTALVSGGGVLQ